MEKNPAELLTLICPKCKNGIIPSFINFRANSAICSSCDAVLAISMENNNYKEIFDLWKKNE